MASQFPATTLMAGLHARFSHRPEDICLIIDGDGVRCVELQRRIASATLGLLRLFQTRPRRVGIRIDDPLRFFSTLLAVMQTGAAAVPLPGGVTLDAIERILLDCKPDYIVCDEAASQMINGCGLSIGIVAARQLEEPLAAPDLGGRMPLVSPDDEATILYSSGTTERPKGVIHTHGARMASARIQIEQWRMNAYSRTWLASPTYMGATLAPLFATLLSGGLGILMSKFRTDEIVRTVSELRPTTIGLVPTQFLMLLSEREFRPDLLSSCHSIICGGSQLDPALRERLFELFPNTFVQVYGSTETDFISALRVEAPPEKRGSVGVPPTEVNVKIVGDDGEVMPSGTVGEIAVSSASVTKGYVDAQAPSCWWHDRTTGALYFRTGDLGSTDRDGYLWIAGRKKEMIICGGRNVYPADVEAVLGRHPAIRESAVVGVPHGVLGEIPVAFVVPRDDAPCLDEAALLRWTNARVSRHQVLHGVSIIPSLPRNTGGKTAQGELRRMAQKRFLSPG